MVLVVTNGLACHPISSCHSWEKSAKTYQARVKFKCIHICFEEGESTVGGRIGITSTCLIKIRCQCLLHTKNCPHHCSKSQQPTNSLFKKKQAQAIRPFIDQSVGKRKSDINTMIEEEEDWSSKKRISLPRT